MNDTRSAVFPIAFFVGLAGCTADKQSSDKRAGDTGPVASIDSGLDTGQESVFSDAALRVAIDEDMAEYDLSAMAVAVVRNGQTVWVEGFGTRSPDDSAPVDADTRFRIASITKPMTAIAVLQQVDAGCLGLSDLITDHMPFDMRQQPGMAATMTVEHTLNMSAGLYDVDEQTGQDGDGQIEPFIRQVQVASTLLAPPGRMYNYSNTNSVLAGRLVELCTSDFYRPYMDAAVFGPLGLSRTTFDTDTVVNDGNYASGVSRYWDGSEETDTVLGPARYSASHLWPAMGAWSSARDLGRLMEFWMAGDPTVLSDALHAEMVASQVDREEGYADSGYGYGLKVKSGIDMDGAHYPVRMVSHDGVIFGYHAHAYAVPELGVGVVVLVNRELTIPMRTIAAGLSLADHVVPTESTTPAPDPSTFAALAGTYTHDIVMGDFQFSVVDGNLEVRIPSLDASGVSYEPRLTALRPDNFELRINGGVELLSFIRDADGNPEYVRNRYYVGTRTAPALAPRLGTVPPAWRSSTVGRMPRVTR